MECRKEVSKERCEMRFGVRKLHYLSLNVGGCPPLLNAAARVETANFRQVLLVMFVSKKWGCWILFHFDIR